MILRIIRLFFGTFFFLLILVKLSFSDNRNKSAQKDTILFELEPITVTASRLPILQNNAVFAVTQVNKINLQSGRQFLSLNESLGSVPGLYTMNSTNFAQDLRLSIRGFGARASFGIRGIKILVDGIPETAPDGQTQLDNLNIGLIRKIEIVRGPTSALYGNSSGGVINLFMEEPSQTPFIESHLVSGNFGYRNFFIKGGKKFGSTSVLLSGAHSLLNGYRDHSAMKNYLLNGFIQVIPDSASKLKIKFSLEHSPQAEDPGALTLEQKKSKRKQASVSNLLYNAGESVTQERIGLSYKIKLDQLQEVNISGYFTIRDFSNRLPFEQAGIVKLNRIYGGFILTYFSTYNWLGFPSRLATGFEYARQQDRRKRYNNNEGTQGQLVFDQDQKYSNAGIYVQNETAISSAWQMSIGLRYDRIPIENVDKYQVNRDGSGEKNFNGYSGSIGLLYNFIPTHNIYTNISSSYEVPTLIELTNNPYGNTGFNENLKPQKAINYELGIKGIIFDFFRYEAAFFSIDVFDEMVPFELAGTSGRTYYRNAGRSKHNGIEIGLLGNLSKNFNLSINYTFSDYYFINHKTTAGIFDGNTIPGISKHMWYGQLYYSNTHGIFGRVEITGRDKIFVNDANTVVDRSNIRINLQGGYKFGFSGWYLEPYAGLNNLLNTQYSDNIRVNAFGERFFEPAPPFNIYIGIKMRIGQ
jgi:iron complex outermembrane receptor protein